MKDKLTFLHIPKTAGLSIHQAILDNGKYKENKNYLYIHENRDDVVENLTQYENFLKRSTVFCFVRNPWDRVVSNYFYALKMWGVFKDDPDKNTLFINQFRKEVSKLSFTEFVKKYITEEFVNSTFHFMSQDMFMEPFELYIDFIGYYKNLEQDLKTFFNIKHIPVINKSTDNRKHYSKYYDEETMGIVEKVYARDIENLGFSFEEISE